MTENYDDYDKETLKTFLKNSVEATDELQPLTNELSAIIRKLKDYSKKHRDTITAAKARELGTICLRIGLGSLLEMTSDQCNIRRAIANK